MTGTEKKMHHALNVAQDLIAKVEARATHSLNDRRRLRLMHEQSDVIVLWLAEHCKCTDCREIMDEIGLGNAN